MEKSNQIIKAASFLTAIFFSVSLMAQLTDSRESKLTFQLSSTLNFSNNNFGLNFSNPLKSGLHFQIDGTLHNKSSLYLSLTHINQFRHERPTGNFELIALKAYSISLGYKIFKHNKKDFCFNLFAGIETRLGNEQYALYPTTIWFHPANIATRTCTDFGISITPNLQYKISSNFILNVFIRQSVFIYFNKNHFPTNIFPSRMNTSIGLGLSYSLF